MPSLCGVIPVLCYKNQVGDINKKAVALAASMMAFKQFIAIFL